MQSIFDGLNTQGLYYLNLIHSSSLILFFISTSWIVGKIRLTDDIGVSFLILGECKIPVSDGATFYLKLCPSFHGIEPPKVSCCL